MFCAFIYYSTKFGAISKCLNPRLLTYLMRNNDRKRVTYKMIFHKQYSYIILSSRISNLQRTYCTWLSILNINVSVQSSIHFNPSLSTATVHFCKFTLDRSAVSDFLLYLLEQSNRHSPHTRTQPTFMGSSYNA